MYVTNKIRWIIIFSLLVFLSGCAKFVKTQSEALRPFSNQTISLVSSLDYGLSDNKILYLRDIDKSIDKNGTFDRYVALENQVGNQLKALVAYSIKIVRISELPVTENEKSNKLADVLISLNDLVVKNEVIAGAKENIERDKKIIAEVRNSEDYLRSIRLLLPIVNDFSLHALEVIDELEVEQRKLVLLFEQAIDGKYGDAIDFEKELRKNRNIFYKALIAISNYAKTKDVAYLDEVKTYEIPLVNKTLKSKKRLSGDDILKIHGFATKRLAMLNENNEQLQPDIDAYYASFRELRDVVKTKKAGIKEARLTFIVWTKAYRQMAAGKTNPAEWFDISDSGSLLMGAAGRAVGL